MPPDSAPDLSVVVVTWNSERVIGWMLESLSAGIGSSGLRCEVVVVDNCSADRTAEVALSASVPGRLRLLANHSNRGLAAANNQGLRATSGRWVLISNPDVVYEEASVQRMVELMDRHPRAAWVVPRILYEDGSLQTSAGDLPSLTEALLGRQVARLAGRRGESGFWWDGWAHDEERVIGRGHECAYLLRRSAIDEVGLQDERYFLDWEGVDWTERFRRRGWEVWLAPEAAVVHLGGESIRQVPVRSTLLTHWGMFLYFAGRRPIGLVPFLALAFGLRAGLKVALMRLGVPMYRMAFQGGKR